MSYLACHLAERVEGADFVSLARVMTSDRECFDNACLAISDTGLKIVLKHSHPTARAGRACPIYA